MHRCSRYLLTWVGAALAALATTETHAQCPLSSCSAGLFQPPTCSQAFTWTPLAVICSTGTGTSSLAITGTGGNPGCYDRLTMSYAPAPGGGVMSAPWLLTGATVTTPIAAINYYEDNIFFGGGPFSTCLIQQNGALYSAESRRVPTGSSWTSRCILNLVPSNFAKISGPPTAPALPQFNGSAPMTLGFVRTFGASTPTTLTSGIDNVRFQLVGLPPTTDNCSGARTIQIGQVQDFDNTCCATTDGVSSCGGVKDVWYKFTAYCTGPITVNTCGTGFDTVLSVFTDCPGTLANEIACNDDAEAGPCNGTTQSQVTFTPSPCTTYCIRVAGATAADCGGVVLSTSQAIPVPANNLCANAQLVPTGTTSFTNCGATTDGLGSCPAPNDVWFRYVATCNGYITATIPGSGSFEPVLSILCDSCGEPYELGCTSATCPPSPFGCFSRTCGTRGISGAYLRVKARAGQSFLIRVGGVNGDTGVGDLIMGCTAAGPDNDNCATPAVLRPNDFLYGSTIGANASGGVFCSATSPDVWYEFYPPTSGNYTFDTCTPHICFNAGQPMYNTVLSVHTDCSNTVPAIGCNDNTCGQQSRVTVALNACQRYLVRVSGFANASGDFTLRASAAPAAPVPSNDNCAGATPIGNGTFAVSTGGATTSTGIPAPPFSMFNDVWYRYCAPCAGSVTISTCESPAGINTALAVYSGACGSLALVASNDNALLGRCAGSVLSSVTFTAVAGQCYSIRVGSPVNGQTYCGRLNVVGPNPSLGTCPSGSVAGIRWFQVMGPSNNTPWSWCLSAPCCFNISGNVTGEPIQTPAINSRNALATRFANSINAACGNGTNLVARSVPASTTAGAGVFSIKARCNPPFVFPYFVFKVGSLGTSCDNQCIVAEVGGLNIFDPIPTSGPCSFNPPIMELPVSGLDCNANEIDDLVDILLGNASDSNGNGVPDSCESLCLGDFNNDGGVDGDDVIAFFSAWDAGIITADVNQDGGVDGDDVITFFNAWDSGC